MKVVKDAQDDLHPNACASRSAIQANTGNLLYLEEACLWNTLNEEIRCCQKLSNFENQIKVHSLSLPLCLIMFKMQLYLYLSYMQAK